MSRPQVNIQRLLADHEELSLIGRKASGGVCRRAFDPGDMAARQWFLGKLAQADIPGRADPAGNLIGRVGPGSGPAVVSGSHLDSVDGGGFYDGALGVLCALEALRVIKENGLDRTPFEAWAFCDEEERFLGFLGSLAICGQVTGERAVTLADQDGLGLAEAMKAAGLEAGRVGEARRAPEEIKYFVELHIEQGPLLERDNCALGLVELVKADYRYGISLAGRRDHAGSPMYGRLDPLQAGVRIIDRFAREVQAAGDPENLFTVGVFEVDPGLQTVIPESVFFTVDIRGRDSAALADLEARLRAITAEESRGMLSEIQVIMREEQVAFDARVLAAVEESLNESGRPWRRIMSGPGHDGQVMGRHFPSGMIFVSSVDGRSHCPEEYSRPEDIEAGANALLSTMLKLAES